MKRDFFFVMVLLAGIGFIGWNLRTLWLQDYRMRRYQPVEVRILGKRLDSKRGDERTTYAPRVRHEYFVDGTRYEAERVTPLDLWKDSKWAGRLTKPYQRGETATGYYNPRNPSDSYLVKYYEYRPFIFICIGTAVILLVISSMSHYAARGKRPPAPKPVGEGRYEVAAGMKLSRRFKGLYQIALYWHTVGLAGLGYSLWMGQPPVLSDPPVGILIYEAIGLIPLAMAVHSCFAFRRFRDARVFVSTPDFRRGEGFEVEVEQRIRSDIYIKEFFVGLLCMVTDTVYSPGGEGSDYREGVFVHDRSSVRLLADRPAPAGEILRGRAAFQVRNDLPPSSLPGTDGYPRYHWLIEVRAEVEGKGRYLGEFPIVVEPGE